MHSPTECILISEGIAELIGTDPERVLVTSNGDVFVLLTVLNTNGYAMGLVTESVKLDTDTLFELSEAA